MSEAGNPSGEYAVAQENRYWSDDETRNHLEQVVSEIMDRSEVEDLSASEEPGSREKAVVQMFESTDDSLLMDGLNPDMMVRFLNFEARSADNLNVRYHSAGVHLLGRLAEDVLYTAGRPGFDMELFDELEPLQAMTKLLDEDAVWRSNVAHGTHARLAAFTEVMATFGYHEQDDALPPVPPQVLALAHELSKHLLGDPRRYFDLGEDFSGDERTYQVQLDALKLALENLGDHKFTAGMHRDIIAPALRYAAHQEGSAVDCLPGAEARMEAVAEFALQALGVEAEGDDDARYDKAEYGRVRARMYRDINATGLDLIKQAVIEAETPIAPWEAHALYAGNVDINVLNDEHDENAAVSRGTQLGADLACIVEASYPVRGNVEFDAGMIISTLLNSVLTQPRYSWMFRALGAEQTTRNELEANLHTHFSGAVSLFEVALAIHSVHSNLPEYHLPYSKIYSAVRKATSHLHELNETYSSKLSEQEAAAKESHRKPQSVQEIHTTSQTIAKRSLFGWLRRN